MKKLIKDSGSDGKYINDEELQFIKNKLKNLFGERIEAKGANKDILYSLRNDAIENISKTFKKTKSMFINEEEIKNITDFAKVIGEFKEKDNILYKCKSFKIEHAPETVLARSYKKFENAIFDGLDIKYSDLKQMKESETLTKEIIEKKIQALVSNEAKYSKTIEKLAKILSETEIMLHGKSSDGSYIKDLISAYENNYDNTAIRIKNIANGKFSKTIDKLIKEDSDNILGNTVKSREEVFQFIDGIKEPYISPESDYGKRAMDIAKEMHKGVGSSKRMAVSRIIDRVQGLQNSQRRLLHTLDYFKREIPKDEYGKHLNTTVKNILLEATSADHTLKLHTDNNPKYYQDLMSNGWFEETQKSTTQALKTVNDMSKGNILDRYENYLKRFRNIMGQNDIDYTKPDHRFGEAINKLYSIDSNTRMQKYNLVAQNPIDFFKKASKTRFENQKWLRIASGIGGTVIGLTVLSQFLFGKINNPHNIQKQVNNDTDN